MHWRRRSPTPIGFCQVARHDHHELLAAKPAGEIDAARVAANPCGELPQHRVPGIVAMAVVDRLEMVDVDQQQRKRLAAPRGVIEQRGEMARRIAAIVQPGERVENGHLDALFEPYPKCRHSA